MRELRFRVWDKVTERYYAVSGLEYDESGELCEIYLVRIEIDESNPTANVRKPSDVVLEQYTGIKDKNGREVYEGDVVEQFVCGVKMFKGKPCGKRTIWQVRWNEYECCFELHYLKGSLFGDSLMNKDDELEVIGNVHENPELIEDKE